MNFHIFTTQKYLKMAVCLLLLPTTRAYTGHTENYDKIKFLEMTI